MVNVKYGMAKLAGLNKGRSLKEMLATRCRLYCESFWRRFQP